jgi:hypothetical protein
VTGKIGAGSGKSWKLFYSYRDKKPYNGLEKL